MALESKVNLMDDLILALLKQDFSPYSLRLATSPNIHQSELVPVFRYFFLPQLKSI